MPTPLRRGTRCAGLVLGALFVVLLLAGWRVPGGSTAPGAAVSVIVNRTGELDIEPAGQLLSVPNLRPGQSTGALFIVTNTTGRAVAVRMRARGDSSDLDDQLNLRVTAWSQQLFTGTLHALRTPTRHSLVLPPGASLPVIVRVWLPSQARAYHARSTKTSLQLLAGKAP